MQAVLEFTPPLREATPNLSLLPRNAKAFLLRVLRHKVSETGSFGTMAATRLSVLTAPEDTLEVPEPAPQILCFDHALGQHTLNRDSS